jgi:diguanylate cyclase (GGDEF)-like protein
MPLACGGCAGKMKSNEDDANKEDQPDRDSPPNGANPATREPLQSTVERVLASIGPETPKDEAVGRVVEDALGQAVRAEERLARAERRIEWLESRNVCDEVTGLLNRRGFGDALHRGLARSRRYGETGSLLLLDLPRQEEVVEAHGAGAGDYVLTAIANILLRRFREVDYIARLERGRFAVLLVQIAQDDARRRAAMLKGHLDEVAVPWHGADIAIHARIGLFHYAQNDIAEDILERAEAELEEREQRIARLRNPAE